MIVWRETPWASVASSMASQPSGASSTNSDPQLRGEPDAPGRSGGELLAGDEAVAEPAVQS